MPREFSHVRWPVIPRKCFHPPSICLTWAAPPCSGSAQVCLGLFTSWSTHVPIQQIRSLYFLGILAWVQSSSHLLLTSFPSGHVPTQLLLFSPPTNAPLKSTVLRAGEACQSVAQEINCASPRPHVSLIVFQPSFKIVKHIIGNPVTIVFRDCPLGIFLPGSFTCSPIELLFCRIAPATRWST
jgi:hypothetical protein